MQCQFSSISSAINSGLGVRYKRVICYAAALGVVLQGTSWLQSKMVIWTQQLPISTPFLLSDLSACPVTFGSHWVSSFNSTPVSQTWFSTSFPSPEQTWGAGHHYNKQKSQDCHGAKIQQLLFKATESPDSPLFVNVKGNIGMRFLKSFQFHVVKNMPWEQF